MRQALGLVEIQGLSTAVVVADTMVKAANIQILEVENSRGLGYMTIKVAGEVGAVNAAVSAGRQIAMEKQKLVSFKVIARPSAEVDQTFCNPQSPKAKKEKPQATKKPGSPKKGTTAKSGSASPQKGEESNEPT